MFPRGLVRTCRTAARCFSHLHPLLTRRSKTQTPHRGCEAREADVQSQFPGLCWAAFEEARSHALITVRPLILCYSDDDNNAVFCFAFFSSHFWPKVRAVSKAPIHRPIHTSYNRLMKRSWELFLGLAITIMMGSEIIAACVLSKAKTQQSHI